MSIRKFGENVFILWFQFFVQYRIYSRYLNVYYEKNYFSNLLPAKSFEHWREKKRWKICVVNKNIREKTAFALQWEGGEGIFLRRITERKYSRVIVHTTLKCILQTLTKFVVYNIRIFNVRFFTSCGFTFLMLPLPSNGKRSLNIWKLLKTELYYHTVKIFSLPSLFWKSAKGTK